MKFFEIFGRKKPSKENNNSQKTIPELYYYEGGLEEAIKEYCPVFQREHRENTQNPCGEQAWIEEEKSLPNGGKLIVYIYGKQTLREQYGGRSFRDIFFRRQVYLFIPENQRTAVYLIHSHEEEGVDEYGYETLLNSTLIKQEVSIERVSENSFVLRIGNNSVEYNLD